MNKKIFSRNAFLLIMATLFLTTVLAGCGGAGCYVDEPSKKPAKSDKATPDNASNSTDVTKNP